MNEWIKTELSKKKLIQARSGERSLPKIKGMVFGDGGVDSNGVPIKPIESSNSLKNELLRKEIEEIVNVSEVSRTYICTLKIEELVNSGINELGLYDDENDIIAIKTFKTKIKDDDLELGFEVNNKFI